MKKIYLLLISVALCCNSYAQTAADYAVMLTSEVTENPPSITLHWNTYAKARSYTVYRKTDNATLWGTAIAILDSTATSYTDNNVVQDSAYEYRVSRTAATGGAPAEGYIYSAIKLHATDYRGKLLLIVDDTFTDSLSTEINQLMKDISGDGWSVVRHDVSRNAPVTSVKSIIVNEYNADPLNTKAVLLLGHVPVPYSGLMNPDGHTDHRGAWPADAYYADVDGKFTDLTVNDSSASRTENRNKPGDGKFDQTVIPSQLELQVSRIDLSNMPAFPKTEKQLLQQYLNRAHDYKVKNFSTVQRGLVDDNFGAFSGEAFASCAWRNFSPLLGDTAIYAKDFFSTLRSENYLWSYGCGGGSYTSCGGVGNTNNFVTDSVKTVFTMLFGSYFGDWDSNNNFLRAPLASPGLALTSCWAGRPYWNFHHMVLGKNIGFSELTTHNNYYRYFYSYNYGIGYMHIALMGDLTLRQHIIAPPSDIQFTFPTGGSSVLINWTPSPDTVDGYYVYRSTEPFGKYDRVTPSILTATEFVDTPPSGGSYYYYAKAVKWENTPSGSYLNTSIGTGGSVAIILSSVSHLKKEESDFMLFPNPASERLLMLSNAPMSGTIQLQNALGQIIFSKEISETSQTEIDVKDLSQGVYFLSLKTDNTSVSRKFVKQ